MVEYVPSLDTTFASLADPTRRDILSRLQRSNMSVSEIADPYDVSLAAISKHLKVLEQAKLITKRKEGKKRIVSLEPEAMVEAAEYLQRYEKLWTERFERLEQYLTEIEE